MLVENGTKDATEQGTGFIDVLIIEDPVKPFIGNMLINIIEKVGNIEVLVVSLFNGLWLGSYFTTELCYALP